MVMMEQRVDSTTPADATFVLELYCVAKITVIVPPGRVPERINSWRVNSEQGKKPMMAASRHGNATSLTAVIIARFLFRNISPKGCKATEAPTAIILRGMLESPNVDK